MANRSSLQDLNAQERMLLMRFVCSFAWMDLEVRAEERDHVARLISRLELDQEEAAQVQDWLKSPPKPDSVDPQDVPHDHRVQFLRAVESIVAVDGEVTIDEREAVIVFAQLIH